MLSFANWGSCYLEYCFLRAKARGKICKEEMCGMPSGKADNFQGE